MSTLSLVVMRDNVCDWSYKSVRKYCQLIREKTNLFYKDFHANLLSKTAMSKKSRHSAQLKGFLSYLQNYFINWQCLLKDAKFSQMNLPIVEFKFYLLCRNLTGKAVSGQKVERFQEKRVFLYVVNYIFI